jgi:hypothetical protein
LGKLETIAVPLVKKRKEKKKSSLKVSPSFSIFFSIFFIQLSLVLILLSRPPPIVFPILQASRGESLVGGRDVGIGAARRQERKGKQGAPPKTEKEKKEKRE